jgi:hypothetical protein
MNFPANLTQLIVDSIGGCGKRGVGRRSEAPVHQYRRSQYLKPIRKYIMCCPQGRLAELDKMD